MFIIMNIYLFFGNISYIKLKRRFFMKFDKYIDLLCGTELFKDVPPENLLILFKTLDYKIEKYSKSDIIFIEDDNCENLGIILEGMIEIQKIDPNGKIMTIATFSPGDVFGEILIFSE